MVIEIEKDPGINVWYRTFESNDAWTQLQASYAKMLPGQIWELSLNKGESVLGNIRSDDQGMGGMWSNHNEKTWAREVRQLGVGLFIHGK